VGRPAAAPFLVFDSVEQRIADRRIRFRPPVVADGATDGRTFACGLQLDLEGFEPLEDLSHLAEDLRLKIGDLGLSGQIQTTHLSLDAVEDDVLDRRAEQHVGAGDLLLGICDRVAGGPGRDDCSIGRDQHFGRCLSIADYGDCGRLDLESAVADRGLLQDGVARLEQLFELLAGSQPARQLDRCDGFAADLLHVVADDDRRLGRLLGAGETHQTEEEQQCRKHGSDGVSELGHGNLLYVLEEKVLSSEAAFVRHLQEA